MLFLAHSSPRTLLELFYPLQSCSMAPLDGRRTYLLWSFVYKGLYFILVAKIIAPLSCVKTMQFYRISILAREEYTRYSSFSRYRVASHRMKLGYKCYLERAFRDPCCLKRSSHASQTASYYDNVEIENLHRQIGLIAKVYRLFCSNL